MFEIESSQMICLIDAKQAFGKGSISSIEFSIDN